ncbi:MAG: hypothetical protein U1E70_10980 [Acetobacteraceae bacterium]|nr:hypothetical protein [Pseudomonadota bacterium]
MSGRGVTWTKQKVNRVCFRGDNRSPTESFATNIWKADSILTKGFDNPTNIPTYRAQPGMVGDIAHGGVCVTTRFSVAPLFPLGSNVVRTFIYAVWVESAWNTHARQVYDAQKILQDATGGNALLRFLTLGKFGNKNPVPQTQAKDLLWALFGDEIVAEAIPAHHVIGAVACDRVLPGGALPKNLFTTGIDYILQPPIIMNTASTVPLAIYTSVLEFLSDELTKHSHGRTPPVEQGFVRSDPKAL